MKVTGEELKKRWDEASDTIHEALFGTAANDQFDQIAEHFHLSDDKKESLSQLCVLVFLGFLHFDDLFKEIRDSLIIDSRVALDVYHELDKKLFDPYRKEIEDNFIKHKIGAIKESEVIQPKPVEPQVVLKSEEGPEVINLKQEVVPVSEPVKLKVISETKPIQPSVQAPRQPAPASMESVMQPKPLVENKQSFSGNNPPETSKAPELPKEEGPMILHKKEEAPTVAQAQATSAFKQSSFGGFFGSFRTMGSQKPADAISVAKIETPGDIKKKIEDDIVQKIPVVVKKYEEPAKTIHYSDLKTPLEKTPDGQLKPIASNPSSPVNPAKSEPKKEGGGGFVDLSNLTLKK